MVNECLQKMWYVKNRTLLLAYSLVHLLTYSLTHSLTYSLTHSLAHALTSLTHLLTSLNSFSRFLALCTNCQVTLHSLNDSITYSHTHDSCTYTLIRSYALVYTHTLMHSCTHSLTHSLSINDHIAAMIAARFGPNRLIFSLTKHLDPKTVIGMHTLFVYVYVCMSSYVCLSCIRMSAYNSHNGEHKTRSLNRS